MAARPAVALPPPWLWSSVAKAEGWGRESDGIRHFYPKHAGESGPCLTSLFFYGRCLLLVPVFGNYGNRLDSSQDGVPGRIVSNSNAGASQLVRLQAQSLFRESRRQTRGESVPLDFLHSKINWDHLKLCETAQCFRTCLSIDT